MPEVDMCFWNFLDNSARRWPDKTAIIQRSERYTYREIKSRVLKVANFLLSLGLKPREEVAVLSPNSINFVELMYANSRLGIVTELLNWRMAPARLCELMEHSKSKVVFFSTSCAASCEYLRKNLSRRLIYVCMDGDVEGAISCDRLHAMDEADVSSIPMPKFYDNAVQIYSSGTTSMPKSMFHTVKDMVLKAIIHLTASGLCSRDIYFSNAPMFHVGSMGMYSSFYLGATCILGEPTVESMVNAIQNEHATRIGVVPTVLNRLMDYVEAHPEIDTSSLNHIEYGSSPMTPEQIKRGMDLFKCDFSQYYGSTETVATITTLYPEDHSDPAKLKSVGRAVMGTDIKVVASDGRECKPMENGEVVVRHPCTIEEYVDNPELSREVIRGEWFYTGDIGHMDNDGYLFLVDRKNDMIISGGENIYPKEVASCILTMGEDIKDVAVTGVPDDKFGEAVMAAIVLRPGAVVTKEDILEHCKKELASYKKPRYIYFMDALPVNDLGKVDRKALKDYHKAQIK